MSTEAPQGPDAGRLLKAAFDGGFVKPEHAEAFASLVAGQFTPPPPAAPEPVPSTGDPLMDRVKARMAGFKPTRPGGQPPLASAYRRGGIR